MRLKESDPNYWATMLFMAANGQAIEAMQARRRGQPDLARRKHQAAQGMRELARGLLRGAA